MAIVPRLKYDSGAVAIYTVDEAAPNDNPFTTPQSNVSRLHFHSGLPMPAIVPIGGNHVNTGTTTLPAISSPNTYNSATYNLLAHGLGATPLCFGRFTSIGGGAGAAMAGSVPLTAPPATGHGRWAHFGANTTHVILRVVSITGTTLGNSLPALDLDWSVYVTDFLLDATPPLSDPGVLLRMEPDRMTANEGQFDSLKRYLRLGSTGHTFPMVKGKTINVTYSGNSGASNPGLECRYSVDGYDQSFAFDDGSAPAFSAAFTDVKLF